MLRLTTRALASRVLPFHPTAPAAAPLQHLLRPLSTASAAGPPDAAAAPSAASAPSRWQLLKRARRRATPPANRTAYVFDRTLPVDIPAALAHVRAASWASFDESLDLVFRLALDPRQADQNLRGALQLPHGTGRLARVAVFADGPDAQVARDASADLVGAHDLVDAIKADRGKSVKGFEACVAIPELLPIVAAGVGKILGPKGLMPAKKDGTVGPDIAEIVTRLKTGQVKYRIDRDRNMHLIVGKLSFTDDMLIDNIRAATLAIMDARPKTVKKKYMEKAFISSSMGPSVPLDLEKFIRFVKQSA